MADEPLVKQARTVNEEEQRLAREIAAVIPYFPYKKLERFYDISGLLAHPQLFDAMCDVIAKRGRALGITKIVAFEARGFLFTPVSIKCGNTTRPPLHNAPTSCCVAQDGRAICHAA